MLFKRALVLIALFASSPSYGSASFSGEESLVTAAQDENLEGIKLIFESTTPTEIIPDDVGEAFQIAAKNGYSEIFGFLLEQHNLIPEDYFDWALEDAAENGRIQIIQLLLVHRAKISAKSARLALQQASYHGHESVVQTLLQTEAFITKEDAQEALFEAGRSSNTIIYELLQQYIDQN